MRFSVTKVVSSLSIAILLVLFYLYQYYENINVQEEELGLSMYYLENITKIDSTIIDLDFNKKQMAFTSKFYINGTGLKLDSNSKGFQQSDIYCSDDLFLQLKDGGGQGLTWTDNKPLAISQYGEIEYVELSKTCSFNRMIIPNGEFTVHLFEKNQTMGASIKNIQFKTSFDSKVYDCKDECVFSKNFIYTDYINSEKNVRNVVLDGINPDTRFMKFDLRAMNVNYEKWSNFFFAMFQVGIGIALSVIVFVFSNEQRKKLSIVVDDIHKIELQQQDILSEQKRKLEHKRKRYSRVILFSLGLIDYEIEGLRIQQKFRDDKSDTSISDEERKKMQINYYEKAQKRFLEINVEYDDILEVFNPEVENQYRTAWDTLRIPTLYFRNNFDDSDKLREAITKIQEEFGKLRDLLIEEIDEKDKPHYKHLFDIKKWEK